MTTKIFITVLLAFSLFQSCSAQDPKVIVSPKAESQLKGEVDSTDKESELAQKPIMKDEKKQAVKNPSKLDPITKEQIEQWVPAKAGDFTRASYDLDKIIDGKKAEVFLVFEKGNQKMEVAILDGVRSPESIEMTKFAFSMDSQFNKTDESINETVAKGEASHISQVDKENKKSQVMALFKDRIIVSAVGENLTGGQLWEAIKSLDVEALVE